LKRFISVLSLLLLASCGGQPARDAQTGFGQYQERHQELNQYPDWALTGRLAVDNGEKGGSGSIVWQVNGDTSRIDFHGAMGRGAWRLLMDDQGAVLETADGRIVRESKVSQLVQTEIGWAVPVVALAWWARGLAAPDGERRLDLDDNGLPERLEQQGWVVNFRRYDVFSEHPMPVRLDAHKGEYRVKLAVSEWRFGEVEPKPAEDDLGH
jgi:outer membrane lipoprotein LolB